MFYETAQKYNGSFSERGGFAKFAPFDAPAKNGAWDELDDEWKSGTVELANSFIGFSYPSLSATDFMDFSLTGNRSRYEEKYFSKRRALSALVLAECLQDDGRYMNDIINGIFSICEESAWQLPAHNTYIRDAVQLPLPDASSPILDLFACETGALLAAVYHLLKEKLDEISPFICKRINDELSRRITGPYLEKHFWWMGNGEEPMCNWTIWCTQNILLTFFMSDQTTDDRRRAFAKACRSIDYFLDEYGDDGCCDEGAQYYRHAALCLFNSIEILNFVTRGAFLPLYDEPKIKNIASYIYNVHIDGEYYVNYADCSPVAGRAGAREFLFARRTNNEPMAAFAARDFIEGGKDTLLLPGEINLFYRIQNAFTVKDMRDFDAAASKNKTLQDAVPRDIYYPSTGVFIARDDTFCLAVKAGDNADSHNHNDTGSFTVYKNGRPMFIDAGVETYTKKTFSPRRYEIWTMQSAYHNLPTINGLMQSDGEEFRARDTGYSFSAENAVIKMDIAGAYPPESGIAAYTRTASLAKGKHITIEDSFSFKDGTGDVVLSLMTYEKPVAKNDGDGLIFDIGDLGHLFVCGGSLVETETIPVTDERLSIAWKHEIYRTLIKADGSSLSLRIS